MPAAAGLKNGDVLRSVGNLAIKNSFDLERSLWDAKPGNHTIEVRATDETGYTQTEKRSPIAPNGSTGWHSVNVTAA